ncbi:hypothetical protein Cgig2_016341 [Carnegiea gigantea]|uniref:Uncharacterized protein n=1 Tax=Carnegiea gigantea TaxID=171969 RepID=A0A9Q1JWD3_9CARY|nr:hypothetical protein Cgig2_016341 [Carnegiea gigantea]
MDGYSAVMGGSGDGREVIVYVLWQFEIQPEDSNGSGVDAHVRMFLKGNDEHGYLYVRNNDGPKRRAQKAIVSHEGRTWSCDHGVVYGRSGRDRNDMIEEGCKGADVKRLRLGEKIIELSNDDEISVASEDVSDDEAAAEGGKEGSKGGGLMKGVMVMTACSRGRVCKCKATTVS